MIVSSKNKLLQACLPRVHENVIDMHAKKLLLKLKQFEKTKKLPDDIQTLEDVGQLRRELQKAGAYNDDVQSTISGMRRQILANMADNAFTKHEKNSKLARVESDDLIAKQEKRAQKFFLVSLMKKHKSAVHQAADLADQIKWNDFDIPENLIEPVKQWLSDNIFELVAEARMCVLEWSDFLTKWRKTSSWRANDAVIAAQYNEHEAKSTLDSLLVFVKLHGAGSKHVNAR